MKIDCLKARELLEDEQESIDLLEHMKECFPCSSVASGLTLLDQGLLKSSRNIPPSDLNDLVLLKVQETKSGKKTLPCVSAKSHANSYALMAIALCVIVSSVSFINNNLASSEISGPIASLANKSIAGLAHLAVVTTGFVFIAFSQVKKGLVCAAVLFSVVLIELVRVLN